MAALDFSRRADTPELMDEGVAGFEEFRACLVDLARVNVLTLTHWPVLRFFERLRRERLLPAGRPLRVVDVGSGYGDLLRHIDRWATRNEVAVELVGVDMNPWSARAAAEATAPGRPIRWVTDDAFAYRPDGGIDLVISSQFAHHLDDRSLSRFLAWMEATARVAWYLADLRRARLPYHVFKLWSRLAGWHRFVQHDGPVSVTRALKPAEWQPIIAAAGLDPADVSITRHIPFRLSLARVKPA
jgi:SAM-dependent methyltransferase